MKRVCLPLISILLVICCFHLFLVNTVHAVEKRYKARVIRITPSQTEVLVTQGDYKGSVFPIINYGKSNLQYGNLELNDEIIISVIHEKTPQASALIVDRVRLAPLYILTILFILIVVWIGKGKGILSLIAMFLSCIIVGKFIIPQIILGSNSVLVTYIGALCIIPLTFVISHGFTWKTNIAIMSTFITLFCTGLLASYFTSLVHLTGFASEEAQFIHAFGMRQIDIATLLRAGILIGAMGVLDDITISQTSIVDKLNKNNPHLSMAALYNESMDVGRDHIASLVNTLVLVYAGASLPLFVLFYSGSASFSEVLNMEVVATEIVRTLVSSIGIIVAVPITTGMAVWYVKKNVIRAVFIPRGVGQT